MPVNNGSQASEEASRLRWPAGGNDGQDNENDHRAGHLWIDGHGFRDALILGLAPQALLRRLEENRRIGQVDIMCVETFARIRGSGASPPKGLSVGLSGAQLFLICAAAAASSSSMVLRI